MNDYDIESDSSEYYEPILDIRHVRRLRSTTTSAGASSRSDRRSSITNPNTQTEGKNSTTITNKIKKRTKKSLFKKSAKNKVVLKEASDEDVVTSPQPVRSKSAVVIEEPADKPIKKRISQDNQYQEFGSGVNGYKFVKRRGSSVVVNSQAEFDRFSVYGGLDEVTFNASSAAASFKKGEEAFDKYSSLDSFKNGRSGSKVKNKKTTYEQYVDAWERQYNSDDSNDLIWPHDSGAFENITTESLKLFFGMETSPNHDDYAKIWKRERIRWHPDNIRKIRHNLPNDEIAKVTKIFQLINDIWENEILKVQK